jgi:hypothetical protein
MNQDFQNTVATWEPTRYEDTRAEDVFLPYVRVLVSWSDIEAAVVAGAIVPSEAHVLWSHWAAAGSPMREAAKALVRTPGAPGKGPDIALEAAAQSAPGWGPRFGLTNTLYYFGGMVAIGAMSLFMTLGWQSFGPWGLMIIALTYLLACLKVSDHLKSRGLTTPAGILATLAVVLVPLVVWAAQHGLELWPPGGSNNYSAYHTVINWRWITLELATLAAGVVMLWRYRLPFMVMPIAVTLWYMNMDVAHAFWSDVGHWDWKFIRDVSLLFGIATVFIALWVDVRCRRATEPEWQQDYAFWLYVFGTVMFWCGLSLRDSDSEWGKFAYCLINLVLVFGGAVIGRRVFAAFGALGVSMYLGYLSHRVFGNSLLFPFALSLLGLGVIALGIWWQRHEDHVTTKLAGWLPPGLRLN